MPKLRSRSKVAPKSQETPIEATPSTIQPLPPAVENAPKLFVLPKDTSKDTRIVTLENPANGTPSRYLFCEQKGFYEFTRIAAPKKACKSWLITSEGEDTAKEEADGELELGSGYVTKNPDLYIATPIDTLFLILPALAPKNSKDTKQLFLCLDDHLDTLSSTSPNWKSLLKAFPTLKNRIEKRMKLICDTVDAGDETMYRLSQAKLLKQLLKKASRMSTNTLPASLEEKFIKTALEIPIMSIKREESELSEISIPEETSTTPSTTTESQPSTTSTADSQDTLSTTATSFSSTVMIEEPSKPTTTLITPPEIPHLLRLRTSLTYLKSTYIPPMLRTPLSTLLASSTTPDFRPLDTHLASLAALKAEALSLRSISDNISRKRGFEDDDEKVAEREEKKRKKEEDEKRKKQESRAVKQLKKVDVSGMKKMSSFFTKAPVKKK